MEFDEFFYDSVLMLAWSDLEDQPNSTSWHYAQRFANDVPVLLLNRNCINDFSLTVERTEFQNIDIVHIPDLTSGKMVEDLKILLSTRGLSRPMIWISDFQDCLSLIHCFPNAFKIFHPLQNSLTMSSEIAEPEMEIFGKIESALTEMLKEVDLYVASNLHEFESLNEIYECSNESLFDKEKILISDSFDEVVEKISNLYLEMRSSREKFNVLVLFDEERIEDQNINDFFFSIKKYSKNRIYFMPRSTSGISKSPIFHGDPNIDVFDAIIFYCSMKNFASKAETLLIKYGML
ncbi:MAG: hypothetical protein CL463_05250 [Acidimicrobiaceae bacterium]|nr:hypothetical protein [Acidimicrobiaceae bacterium]